MNPIKLLIIGKNDTYTGEISNILTPYYDVIISPDYPKKMSLLEQFSSQAELVLLPVHPNDPDGIRCLKQFRVISPTLPILIYSECADIQLVIECMKRGAQNLITLPIESQKLLDIIAASLEEKNHSLETAPSQTLSPLGFHERLSALQEKLIDRRHLESPITADEIVALFSLDTHKIEFNLESFRFEVESHLDAIKHPKNNNKILIIEDEEDYSEMLMLFLDKDYSVSSASTGKKALEILEENPDFDIILLDIFLPDIQGTELLSQIKAISKNAEIIIVTAFELIDIAIKTFKDGAFDFITKPVLKDDLLRTIKQSHHKRFLKHVLPKMGEDFLQNKLPKQTKLNLLTGLLENRLLEGKTLCMKDLYLFFPQLRASHIPDELPLPKSVLQKGLTQFIEELGVQTSLFSSREE